MANNILRSPYPDTEIPTNISLTNYLLSQFIKFGDRQAIVDGPSDRSYTFTQLCGMIKKAGAGLSKLGFKKGDVLALFSPNLPEFPVALLAAIGIGGAVTTVNPLYTAEELSNQLKDSKASILLTIPPFLEKAKEAAAKNGIRHLLVFGEAEGVTPFASLMASDVSEYPVVAIDPKEDIAVLPYSSGTSGLPKGVILTHHNIISNLIQIQSEQQVDWTDKDVIIGFLPFFHIYGLVLICFGALLSGCKVVTMPRFDGPQFLELIQKHSATVLPVVPPIILFLAKHPIVEKYDLSKVRSLISGAAPLGSDLMVAATKRLNIGEVSQGYGMTEASPVTHVSPVGGVKPGSVGVLIRNTEAKIIDIETGESLGLKKEGELCIRGPQVMKGYLNNEEATKRTVVDGWLHTGDIAYYDEDGHFFIVDRLKELIKYKGFQVAPAELEGILLSNPKIADAAVIGVPDLEAGELPKAFIVKKEENITEEDVMKFLEPHVAHYKQLRFVEFVPEIPKSASGKILRRVLKQKEVEKLNAAITKN